MHVFQAFSTPSHRDPFSSMQASTNSMKQLQSEASSFARTNRCLNIEGTAVYSWRPRPHFCDASEPRWRLVPVFRCHVTTQGLRRWQKSTPRRPGPHAGLISICP